MEIALIVATLFVFVGGPPPGDDEPHYLGKAKQYWNPSWLEGDFFLETPDAHVVFNWTVGWLTLLFSLDTTAWMGRAAAWLLLAVGWYRLSWAVVPRPFMSLLTMGLFLVFQAYGTAAREWMVGGVEAKCFAYGFVLLGLEQLVRGRWRWVWPLMGAAGAFHVLVGGWAVIAALLAWLVTKKRPPLVGMLPSLAAGGLLSLPGVIPAAMLTWNADPDTVREANRIYVFDRLSHHLVVHDFPPRYLISFGLVLVAWLLVCYFTRRISTTMPLRRFVLGSLMIGIAGFVIDQATLYHPDIAAALLRYYWYRLPDVMVPLGLAFALAEGYVLLQKSRPDAARTLLLALCLVPMIVIPLRSTLRMRDPRPGADVQGRVADYRQWRVVCAWIRQNTPPDSRFLTPPNVTTFRWYAQRSEVVSWKDIPQNAAGIVEWAERRDATRRWWGHLSEAGYDASAHGQLLEMARSDGYDFQYVIVARHDAPVFLPLPMVFATSFDQPPAYAVYSLPPSSSGDTEGPAAQPQSPGS